MSAGNPTADELRRLAKRHWEQDRPPDAFAAAWAAFDLAPTERATRTLLASLLEHYPAELKPDRRADYLKLLTDREIEPDLISTTGWQLLRRGYDLAEEAADTDFEAVARALGGDELALTLLRESPVYFAPSERLLTGCALAVPGKGEGGRTPKLPLKIKCGSMAAHGRSEPMEARLRDADRRGSVRFCPRWSNGKERRFGERQRSSDCKRSPRNTKAGPIRLGLGSR